MFKRLMQRFVLLEGEVTGDAPAGGAPAAAPTPAPAPAPAPSPAATTELTPPGNLVADAAAAPAAGDPAVTEVKEGDPKEGDPAEKKEGDPAEGAEKKPIEYTEFKLPEGVEVDEKKLSDFKSVAAEAGLTQDQAQLLVDMHANAAKSASDASTQLWYDTQKQWQEQVLKDPEIGGKNFEPMKATVAKAIDVIGGDDAKSIREAFELTGAGNNPAIIKFLYRLGKTVGEGGSVDGGAPANVEAPKSAAQKLYPSQPTNT